jgi:hypothetical protein
VAASPLSETSPSRLERAFPEVLLPEETSGASRFTPPAVRDPAWCARLARRGSRRPDGPQAFGGYEGIDSKATGSGRRRGGHRSINALDREEMDEESS